MLNNNLATVTSLVFSPLQFEGVSGLEQGLLVSVNPCTFLPLRLFQTLLS